MSNLIAFTVLFEDLICTIHVFVCVCVCVCVCVRAWVGLWWNFFLFLERHIFDVSSFERSTSIHTTVQPI